MRIALLSFLFLSVLLPARSNAETIGQRHVAQLLDDRPDMNGILADDDPLILWISARFDTDAIGMRVRWDNAEPSGDFDSTMSPATTERPGIVLVSSSPGLTGRDRWCLIVYELQNLANGPRIAELVATARDGKIGQNDFSIECIKLEHAAVLRTQKTLARFDSLGQAEPNSLRYA